MALFSFIAGVLVGVAAVCVALPLCRNAAALSRRRGAYVRAGAVVASFAVAAGILYLAIGSRHGPERPGTRGAARASAAASAGKGAAAAAKSMDAEVAGLEARLARDGGTPADWSLLAQAYDVLRRPEDAKRARAKAGNPASGPAVWQMGAGALTAAAAAADRRASATGPAAMPHAAAPAAPSAADLERRVAANPRDAQSWLALADLRRGQRDWAGARAAYTRLVDLRAMSTQSWANYADVLGSIAGGSLIGEAGRAIDNALALDGANPKALWLKASQANEQRRFAEALVWWKKLRGVLPPDSADVRMVDANIAEASSLATPSPTVPTATVTASTDNGANAEVSGTVSLDRRLADQVQPDATLFIYAKAADSPGPPLAIVRATVGTWPVNFRLDDSMAMISSRRLSQFDRVVIEARISRNGQATPAAGDLYVTSQVLRPVAGTRLALVINHEIG
jgi:cytochrome c-type biogenesis protein CcmH